VAAKIDRRGDAVPAGSTEGLVGFLPAFGGDDAVGRQLAAGLVTQPIQGGEHFTGEFGGFFENGVGHVRRCFLKTRELAQLFVTGQFIHHETHVLERGTIVVHFAVSVFF
jgi:hypothetical protein